MQTEFVALSFLDFCTSLFHIHLLSYVCLPQSEIKYLFPLKIIRNLLHMCSARMENLTVTKVTNGVGHSEHLFIRHCYPR